MTQRDNGAKWELVLQLLVEYEQMVELVRLGSDKKCPAV
jgi:hypothetical protein